MPLLGELAGLGCALCWAATTLLVRQEARRANVLLVNAIASTAAAGWMLALALVLGLLGRHAVAFGSSPWRGLAFLVLSVVLSLGIGDSLYFLALQRVGVGRAMPLSMSEPLLATLLAVLVLGERATPGLLAGLVLIPGGLYLVTAPPRGRIVKPEVAAADGRLGIALALGAAVFWALSAVSLRPGLDQVDVLTASAIRTTVGAALVWLIALRSRRWIDPVAGSWPRLRMALLAGTFSSGSTFLFSLAVSEAGAARAATLAATSPLYAVPLSALLLREQVSRSMLLGTVIAMVGVGLVVGV